MNLAQVPFTLRQLQYFVAVAEELSFRRAAERCGVSQPGLSAQLAALEAALDLTLFERGPRVVRMTHEGERLVVRAREVLRSTAEFVREGKAWADPEAGELRLGVIPTVGPYLLPQLAGPLSEKLPRVAIEWIEDKTDRLMEWVKDGELDGALLALEAEIGDVDREELFWDEFLLAAPKGHALDKRRRYEAVDLEKFELLLLDEGHCLRDQVVSFCTPRGQTSERFRATSLSTLAAMVAAGRGVTLLPRLSLQVENRHARISVRRPHDDGLGRTIGLVWRPGAPTEELFRRVAKVARAAIGKRPGA